MIGQITTHKLNGKIGNSHIGGSIHKPTGSKYPDYEGETTFTSNTETTQTVLTEGKSMNDNITINPNTKLQELNPQDGFSISIL